MKHPIRVRNIDGTTNANGNIKEKCLITFRIGDEEMTEWFHVTNTGDQNLILGLPWQEETFNDTVEIGKFTMAQKIDQKYCKPEEEVRLPPEYVEYSSVFEKEASKCFPERRHWDHVIKLHDDFVPKKG